MRDDSRSIGHPEFHRRPLQPTLHACHFIDLHVKLGREHRHVTYAGVGVRQEQETFMVLRLLGARHGRRIQAAHLDCFRVWSWWPGLCLECEGCELVGQWPRLPPQEQAICGELDMRSREDPRARLDGVLQPIRRGAEDVDLPDLVQDVRAQDVARHPDHPHGQVDAHERGDAQGDVRERRELGGAGGRPRAPPCSVPVFRRHEIEDEADAVPWVGVPHPLGGVQAKPRQVHLPVGHPHQRGPELPLRQARAAVHVAGPAREEPGDTRDGHGDAHDLGLHAAARDDREGPGRQGRVDLRGQQLHHPRVLLPRHGDLEVHDELVPVGGLVDQPALERGVQDVLDGGCQRGPRGHFRANLGLQLGA
mmetsp:Transcript_1140/g.3160  ORF Transcript_1140/g.3160 Transcript_1140/m.3160 type:complete len:364 (-) Transcript_1140:129-1220(-)